MDDNVQHLFRSRPWLTHALPAHEHTVTFVQLLTNGGQTWVNGPFGLQQRANTQRFSWEYNPDGLQIVPAPVNGDR